MDKICNQTKIKRTVLNKILQSLTRAANLECKDEALQLIKLLLNTHYKDGDNLKRLSDGIYYGYNGKCWNPIHDDLLKKQLLELVSEIAEGHISSLLDAALNILEGEVFCDTDIFRRKSMPPMVYNCNNGEAWISENGDITFKPHCAQSYLTSCLQVDYDPNAIAPKFLEALQGVFRDNTDPDDMIRNGFELVGYICQPWRKIAVIAFLYGQGNNGKTVLTSIIDKLLGNSGVMACRIDKIEHSPFQIGALVNKFLIKDDDVDAGTLLPDGFLKKISEEKMMTGEHKHRDSFEFVCRAVPLLLGNDYPSMKDLSYGMQRRLMVIPFKRIFKQHEDKKGLFDELWEDEASGILNLAIDGFKRLKARGHFQNPIDCQSAKEEWLMKANILAQFIEQQCGQEEDNWQFIKDFYERFKSYCKAVGVRNTLQRTTVMRRLQLLGYEVKKLDGHDRVKGLISLY